MSYTVKKKDFLNPTTIASRVIVQGLANDKFGNISDEVKEKVADVDEWEIDLKVNGVEVDPTKFFDYLYEMYDSEIEQRAKMMIDDKIKDSVFEGVNELYEINDKLRSLNESLDWG